MHAAPAGWTFSCWAACGAAALLACARQSRRKKMRIVRIKGDGRCLFRALVRSTSPRWGRQVICPVYCTVCAAATVASSAAERWESLGKAARSLLVLGCTSIAREVSTN